MLPINQLDLLMVGILIGICLTVAMHLACDRIINAIDAESDHG